MSKFSGEYDCKLDAKNRFRFPAGLLKQLEKVGRELVLNRGVEKCLVLQTKADWDKKVAKIEALNEFDTDSRRFARYFLRGATHTVLDSADRMLIPKRLQEYANISKEMIIYGYLNRIEIWSKEEYENMLGEEPDNFAEFAQKVLGGKGDTDDQ